VFPPLIARFFFGRAGMRTVVIGGPAEAKEMAQWMEARRHCGIDVIGWLARDDAEPADPIALPRLGAVRELRRVLVEHDVTQLLVSQAEFSPAEADELAQAAEELGCRVRFFANVRRFFGDRPVRLQQEDDYTFITRSIEPLDNPLNQIQKRILDIVVALPVILFVLPPLIVVVWFMQRLQSPGPLFHCQFRSGLNRRKFLIYKFRTMRVQTSDDQAKQASRNDARIYPFGRFLRRASLDEIPQFINVLKGDMSVSGPRPHLLEHDAEFAKIVNFYHARHFVKPGITGLAQSMGFRGEISEPSLLRKRIGYDMVYIRRWSLSLDLQILANTVRQVFFPPGSAY